MFNKLIVYKWTISIVMFVLLQAKLLEASDFHTEASWKPGDDFQ